MQVTLEDTLKSSFSVPVGLGQAYTQDASVDRPLVLLLLIKESSIFIVAISVLYMSTPAIRPLHFVASKTALEMSTSPYGTSYI